MSNRTSGHPRLVLRCGGQARALAVRVVFAWSSLFSGFVCVCVCFFLPTERSSRLVLTPRESCFQSCLGFEFHRKFLCVFGVGRAFPRPPPARVAGSADGFADVTPASWDRMELLPSRVSLYGIGFHSSVPRAGYAHLCSREGSAQWFFSLEIPFPGSDIKVMLTQENSSKKTCVQVVVLFLP